ncbi:MAG: extracellular solute-binding protein [Acidimicrobiales bacterium]
MVTRASLKFTRLSGRAAAALAAGLSISTAAAVAVPATSSYAQTVSASSSAPTASISVWMEASGTPVDNYWVAQAKAFEKANPGDTINVEFPAATVFNSKVAASLAGNNPPALTFGWGGGRELQYINSKVVAPIGDAGQNDAGNPSWKKDFVPSSLGAVTFNNKIYGIPVGGTQPVFFFYNKKTLAKYHLSFPSTTTQLLADVKTLAKHDVTTIALGNLGGWEGLMYLEYFADRIGGPQVFLNIQAGKKGAWSNPAIIQALSDIQALVKANAFEQGYNQIDWPTGFPDALVHSGTAAMQLMGDWDIGNMQGYFPGWVASGAMGIGFFPRVPGGKGNPADLEGNTTDYLELASHLSPAETYVAEKFAAWLCASPAYAKFEVSEGLVPVIAGSSKLFASSPLKQYLVPIYNAVQHAPYFQYSWDQALGPKESTPLYSNLQKVFGLTETPQQFAKTMNTYL